MERDTVKVVTPKALKRTFKATCSYQDTDMSSVICLFMEQWCADNNQSLTIAQLVRENRAAAESADLGDVEALASGKKPTQDDLGKLAIALGVGVDFLQTICDRTFSH